MLLVVSTMRSAPTKMAPVVIDMSGVAVGWPTKMGDRAGCPPAPPRALARTQESWWTLPPGLVRFFTSITRVQIFYHSGMLWALWAVSSAVAGCTLGLPGPGAHIDQFAELVRRTVATHGNRTEIRTRRHTWGNLPAHDALDFFRLFVVVSAMPPAPIYVAAFSKPNTLGLYDGNIKILNTLTANQETWVVIHELLHWAGFGTAGGPSAQTQQLYRDEMENVAGQIAFDQDGVHWNKAQMPGTHRATGLAGSAELMTPQVDTVPFLAAATLNELRGAQVVGHRWCTASQPCSAGAQCTEIDRVLPRVCTESGADGDRQIVNANGGGGGIYTLPDVSLNDGEVTDDAALGIVLGSLGGVALLAGVVWAAYPRWRNSADSDVTSAAWLLAH